MNLNGVLTKHNMAPTVKNHNKKKRTKINLIFDENKRREFLTGFHKRKLQRKKEAKENLEKELKEERKRLKSEAKESYKKLVVSHRDIPELEHLNKEEYEEEDVTVKIVELSSNELAKENNWIGANCPFKQDDEEEDEEESEQEENEVPGMELKPKRIPKKPNEDKKKFNSEKDVKRQLKKQATKNVQKSKAFQKKSQIERQKQRKKSLKQKKLNQKFLEKRHKKSKRSSKT